MTSIKPAPSTAAASQQLPTTALASPYDGTTPALGQTMGYGTADPTMTGLTPQLTGLGAAGASSPQINATNQTAYAPNGDVNQVVTNDNTNRYYNIIVPNHGLFGGAWNGVSNLFGGWNQPGNTFVDPATGVMYVQKDTGIVGWFKRLFRGY